MRGRPQRKPLAEACAAGNLEIDSVIAALEEAEKKPGTEVENWAEKSLESLSSHIVAKHHAYVKGELPRLAQLAQKVVNRHGSTKPELPVIANTLMQLDEELTQHLAKEEAVLFPYIAAWSGLSPLEPRGPVVALARLRIRSR